MKARNNISWFEVLPKAYYQTHKHNPRGLMRMLDTRILDAGQWFIERNGTCYLNDWYWGNSNDSRGWRPPDDPDGSRYSQHKFGRALDLVPKKKDPLEIHKDIIRNAQLYQEAGFTCFECIWDAETWIHGDCRAHDKDGLLFVPWTGEAYTLQEYVKELQQRCIII